MNTIRVEELQRDLLVFLKRVEAGESFLVVSGEHPLAEVRPVSAPIDQSGRVGQGAGQLQVPAELDQPLPDDVVEDFERE